MSDSAKIQIKNLYKIFGNKPESVLHLIEKGMTKQELLDEHGLALGLNNINLDIPAHKISVIMGLSGSGKSTLIRHINRLIEPTAGEMVIDGENVLSYNKKQLRDFRRSKTAMVFQNFGLLVHQTVMSNVTYGLKIQGVGQKERQKKAQYWIDRVGLSGFEKQYPAQLSGGMQQRVGLARALANDADILLMDEAFSALDPLIRYDMQSILLELQEELNKTIVFITHDLDEAIRLGDHVAILRDGAIVQTGSAQNIVLHPKDDYIFDFVKDINRGRALWLRSVIEEGEGQSTDGPKLSYDTLLEEALQVVMDASNKTVNVIDKNGDLMGYVTLDNIVKALARPSIDGDQTVHY